eukprot:3275379-Pyramimonas_sp.AAC.1
MGSGRWPTLADKGGSPRIQKQEDSGELNASALKTFDRSIALSGISSLHLQRQKRWAAVSASRPHRGHLPFVEDS